MSIKRTISPTAFVFLCFCVCLAPRADAAGNDAVSPQVEEMVQRGLRFLAGAQAEDGSFPGPSGTEPGVVGLALMAMLSRGDDPNHGPYKVNLERGISYLLRNQNKTTGYIGSSMYNHGFSTLALAELYGAIDDPRLGPALKNAVALILSAQSSNPYNAWRYGPDSQDADTTVSGGQLVALFAARNAGLEVPDEAIESGIQFLKQCQDANGGIGYTNAHGANAPRTAIGLLVFSLARKYDDPSYKAALRFLRSGAGSEDHYYHYYLYYAAQAWFQAAPEEWREWNERLVKELGASQTDAGSWEGQFGPAFTTSASLLALALNYRLLPIYER